MEIYSKKKRWKLVLFITGLILILVSVVYTNSLVSKFAEKERNNVKLWADAVHRKAELMEYTENFFRQLGEQEKNKATLVAKVYNRLLSESNSGDLTFFLEIIHNNNTIPVILTDEHGKIISSKNLKKGQDTIEFLEGPLKEEFSVYAPIIVEYIQGKKNYLYYKNSNLYTKLKTVLNDYISIFIEEVTKNSASVPVIITDSTKQHILIYGNLDTTKMKNPAFAKKKLEEMMDSNPPITLDFLGKGKVYIYYQNSELLTKMKWFPLAQLLIIFVFVGIAYLLFSVSRRAEQSRVWAGMARETAHQIGTPLSSIMAWLELLKMDPANSEKAAYEIEKDIKRLEMITERFSKIGSKPTLEPTNISDVVRKTLEYLKPRTPRKVNYIIDLPKEDVIGAANAPLFSWVLENLIKNAIDAMDGKGTITLNLCSENNHIIIDVTDTGKGISKSEQYDIFNPGYTTKKRGWGLGLSLAKRIIKEYHKGKIFVKSSSPGKGTTFRIILKKNIESNE
jgi:two-component sensor histidine kinase